MAALEAPSRVKLNVSVDVANRVELRVNAQHVLETTRAARPKNTSLAYDSKQIEFQVPTPILISRYVGR
jgi:hypothetical protein